MGCTDLVHGYIQSARHVQEEKDDAHVNLTVDMEEWMYVLGVMRRAL